MKHKLPNCLNHDQNNLRIKYRHCSKYQVPALALTISSEYVAHAQNSFYHFRMVATHATFGLLAVTAFLKSNNMPTALIE